MKNKRPLNVPGWLQDPDGTAPCLCGLSLLDGDEYIVIENDGMKRWFHRPCWEAIMEMDDEED